MVLTYYRANKYVTVKVSTSLRKSPTTAHRELRIYEHLSKVKSAHPGQSLIRELYDTFELEGGRQENTSVWCSSPCA